VRTFRDGQFTAVGGDTERNTTLKTRLEDFTC